MLQLCLGSDAKISLSAAESSFQPHPSGKLPPFSSSLGHLGSLAPVELNTLTAIPYVSTDVANTLRVLSLLNQGEFADPDKTGLDQAVPYA